MTDEEYHNYINEYLICRNSLRLTASLNSVYGISSSHDDIDENERKSAVAKRMSELQSILTDARNEIVLSYGTPSPENIQTLKPNEIFVFGSNLVGKHGKGAALTARRKFGAIPGYGEGHFGQSYAIPTKDEFLDPCPVDFIASSISNFIDYAISHPEYEFLVTKIGCGLANFDVRVIANLFYRRHGAKNIHLPKEFIDFGTRSVVNMWKKENQYGCRQRD